MNSSILISVVVAFIQSAQSGLFQSSMYPYIQTLDPKITEGYFGFIVASFHAGSCVAAIIFGVSSTKTGKIKTFIEIGLLFMFLGNTMYFFIQLLPTESVKVGMLLSRLITGAGAGLNGLLNAYVANISGSHVAKNIAIVTGASTLGLAFGPAIQNFFTFLGYPGVQITERIFINQYNIGSILAAMLNVVSGLTVVCFLKDVQRGNIKEERCAYPIADLNWNVILLCLLTRFIQLFVVINLDAVSSPYTKLMFGWDNDETLRYNSTSSILIGIIALATYMLYTTFKYCRFTNHRLVTCVSLACFFFYYLVSYPYEFINEGRHNNSTRLQCNLTGHGWCQSMATVSLYRYFLPYYILIAVPYCYITVSCNTVLAWAAGHHYQSVMQSLNQVAGSMSCIIGPILFGHMFRFYGPSPIWLLEMAATAVTSFLWLLLLHSSRRKKEHYSIPTSSSTVA